MSIKYRLKSNRFIRGIYFLYKSYFGHSKRSYGYYGDNVTLTPPYFFTNPENIFLGDNSSIGRECHISSPNAKCYIKENCAIASNVSIHTGNHARCIGLNITDINDRNKPSGYDKDVTIERDVWIGTNVTILSGVTIGRGCTIAAGAVVNSDTPPYSLCGGVPAKFIKFIWTIDEIIKHESSIYLENERLSREELITIFEKYNTK